jgi:hypothetical protein
MSVAKDCQRYAVWCLQDARTTVDPRQKLLTAEEEAFVTARADRANQCSLRDSFAMDCLVSRWTASFAAKPSQGIATFGFYCLPGERWGAPRVEGG